DGGTGTDGSGSDSGTGTDGGGDSGSGTGTGDGGGSGDGGDGSDNGTELDAPNVTLIPKEQKIVVSWSPVDNATSYNLRWQNADGTENIVNVSAQQVANGADPIMFAHAPLVADTPYTYTVTAVAADGTEAVGTPLTGSALALGCNPSTYSPEGLVAYYNFEGNLNDSAGSYDLTATGDSIVYSNGCVNGKTGHFDGDGGYGYNLDFTDENVAEVADGSFSISVWVNADEDMNKWASVFSTTAVHENDELEADGWGKGFQLNVDGNMRPQLFACKHCGNNQKLTAPNQLQLNTWTHLAITVDNRTAKLYVDGALVGTHNKIDTEFNRLKVGLNRYGQQPWKGYADELMIFGDALTDDEMMSIYKNTLPGTPENVTAINWTGDAVVVGWDAVDGTNEYRVYYSTDDTVGENSPYITVTGGTVVNFDNLTQRQDYTYAVAGVSPLGVGELSAPATITVDSTEPVYVDKKVGFHYEIDYVNTNPSSSHNPASYNSRNFQVAEPNMRAHAYLFVAAGDKVKEHGMHINQYKTTITINDPASTFYKRQIDVVDKHGGWSYFNYTLITLDQTEFNNWALKTGKMECWGQAFNTIAEYTACNPEWVQAQKDKWVRDSGGSNNKKMLNDFIPVKDGYYTIEVKKYRGSQHYNYSKYDGVRNFTIVTQQ
ncbi:MAG TPA: hypothetical protein DGB85_10900, partial [Deltaproteobacteria bacterium]|nr:hypothetical protein [Deltaproteobacteria bacterium]